LVFGQEKAKEEDNALAFVHSWTVFIYIYIYIYIYRVSKLIIAPTGINYIEKIKKTRRKISVT
jgi:hypothetical protein